jgi:ribokinase
MTGSIVVVGSINVDLIVRCERLPRPGQTVLGETSLWMPGGKGANQAVAAARLGARVAIVGCVGSDAHGAAAIDALRDEGVDVRHVEVVSAPTGLAVVQTELSGENCITVVPGANELLTPLHVDAAEELIAHAAVVVTQLEVPLAVVAHAVALARRHRVPVLLNPAPARPLSDDLWRGATWLVPNESEAESLVGWLNGSDDVAALAQALAARGPAAVVVTLGARGVVFTHQGRTEQLAVPSVHVVDTTGAGDAFVGALAVAMAEGREDTDSIEFAQCAAAISVGRSGAQAAMPQRAEVDDFLARVRGST